MRKLYLLLGLILLFLTISCDDSFDQETPAVVDSKSINIKTYGAVGDENADDTKSIQNAIDECELLGGGDVIIPKGRYKLTSAIVAKSNVNLKLDKEAILLRYHDWYMVVTTPDPKIVVKGFEAASNFNIEGGVFDMRGTNQDPRSCIVITHSENMNFRNITILDCLNETHAIDITGGRNTLIDGCTFSGKQYKKDKPEGPDFKPYAEAIQIDLAKPGSTAAIEGNSYDYTVTENVIIRNCTFKDGWARAVSSHSSTYDIFYKNISIENNKMIELIDYAISALKCMNWNIVNNEMIDCEGGIRFKQSEPKHSTPPGKENNLSTAKLQGNYNNKVIGNKIINTESKHAIQFFGTANTDKNYGEGRSKGGDVINNVIDKVGGNGIDINRSDDILIKGNKISNYKKDAIKIYFGCQSVKQEYNIFL